MKEGTLKKCPRCNKLFTCHGDNDCWCEHHQVHKKNMLFIMENYKDCICPDCLKKFSEK